MRGADRLRFRVRAARSTHCDGDSSIPAAAVRPARLPRPARSAIREA